MAMRRMSPKQLVEFVRGLEGNTLSMRVILGDKLITCPACGMKYVEGTVHPGYNCPACEGSWERAQWLERSVDGVLDTLLANTDVLTVEEMSLLHQGFFESYYGLELGSRLAAYKKQLKGSDDVPTAAE